MVLLKEVLVDLQYLDRELVDEIANGFTLHGSMTEANVFPKETKRPEYNMDLVKSMVKGLNNVILKQVQASQGMCCHNASSEGQYCRGPFLAAMF